MEQILESLTDRQRQDTLTLMEMFNMSIEEANTLMLRNRYNLQNAVSQLIPGQEAELQAMVPEAFNPPARVNVYDVDNDEEIQYNRRRDRMNRRELFHQNNTRMKVHQYKKTYLIKKKEKPKKLRKSSRRQKGNQHKEAQNQSSSKAEEQFEFVPQFAKMFDKTYLLLRQDLYDVFEEMLDTKKIVALHCIPLSQHQNQEEFRKVSIDYIKQLYSMKQFAGNFNKHFINYGLDPNKFDYNHYPFMRNLVNPTKDQFVIIILRLNQHNHKVQIFRKLQIADFFRLNQPDRYKIICETICKESHRIAYNHSAGIKPPTEAEKQKMEEDRLLREQQEAEYMQNMKIQEDIKEKEIIQEKQQQQEIQNIEHAKLKRAAKRQKMQKYDKEDIQDGIELKIRLPNSDILHLKLPKTITAKYLFDYIQTYEQEDIGFDDQIKRNFDILQPYQKISLAQQQEQELRKIFDNSDTEVLVVKEQ